MEGFLSGLSQASKEFELFGGKFNIGLGGITDAVLSFDHFVTGTFDAAVSKVVDGAKQMASAGTGFAEQFMNVGMQFDSAMSQVGATMLKTRDDMDSEVVSVEGFSGTLREFAKKMGAETQFSAAQAAEALNYMALAGYDAEKSVQMLPKVLSLAAAGGMDLAAASDMVTDAQSALGLSIEETNQLVNEMAKTAASSNTSVSQLGDGILSIGATAKSLKGGMTELNTMLGALADNGYKASEGGNMLRRIFLNLSAPADNAKEKLQELGVAVYDASGSMRTLPDVFADLNAATSKLTEQGKIEALNTIFSQYSIGGANALLGTTAERYDELSKKIKTAGEEGTAASDMAGIQLDNLQGRITILKSAFESLQIAFSDIFSGKANEYVNVVSNGLSDIQKQINEGDFKGGFTALGRTFAELINKGADDILNSTDEAAEFADGLINFLKKSLNTLIDRGAEVAPVIFDFAAETGTKALSALADVVSDETNQAKIRATVQRFFSTVQKFLDENEDSIFTIVDLFTNMGLGFFDDLFVLKRKTIKNIILREIKKNFDEAWNQFTTWVRQNSDWEEKATQAFTRLAGAAWNNIVKWVRSASGWQRSLTDAISGIFDDAFKPFLDENGEFSLVLVGQRLVEGLWNGFLGGIPSLITQIPGVASGVIDAINSAFDIHSPSKLTAESGRFLAMGLGEGFAKEMDNVSEKMQNMLPSSVDFNANISRASSETKRASPVIAHLSINIERFNNNTQEDLRRLSERLLYTLRAGAARESIGAV